MSFVRTNALALDFGVLPKHPGPASIKKFLELNLKLDMNDLQSVQIHSKRAITYIGLSEELPAAAIAERHHLQHEMWHDGKPYRIPVQLADDNAVDVRVYDLPPKIPSDAIAAVLHQYGEVLAIREEIWRNYFPGLKSGVRAVRMHIANAIPKHLAIPNTKYTAHIRYPGQPRKNTTATRHKLAAPEASEVGSSRAPVQATAAAVQNKSEISPAVQLIGNNKQVELPASTQKAAENRQTDDASMDYEGFQLVVKRRRSNSNKTAPRLSPTSSGLEKNFFAAPSSDSELDEELLKHMTLEDIEAYGGSKKYINIRKWAKAY